MTVIFHTASCAAFWIIMLPGDFCVPFVQKKTIGSSVLLTCKSIGATVCRGILFISSALDSEDTWMETAHAWVFVVKLGGLRGVAFSLKTVPDDVSI